MAEHADRRPGSLPGPGGRGQCCCLLSILTAMKRVLCLSEVFVALSVASSPDRAPAAIRCPLQLSAESGLGIVGTVERNLLSFAGRTNPCMTFDHTPAALVPRVRSDIAWEGDRR
jgi:hypothetical protein